MPLAGKILNRLKRPMIWELDSYHNFKCKLQTSPFAEAPLESDLPAGITLREINNEDHKLLHSLSQLLSTPAARFPHPVTVEWLHSLFQQGERCFCAIRDGSVIGLLMASPTNGRFSEKFAAIVKSEAGSWVTNTAFVDPIYRGMGLHRFVSRFTKSRLKEAGGIYAYSFVGVHNLASAINTHQTNDEYRVVYHLSVDIPLARKMNLYPKINKENWRPCLFKPASKQRD
ncbi:MAG: GNAT family N-acetyltransferase [Ectothiorhodospiraceae bacterium]|nr:GNAT family N-acetyltransferase [Ectothiorhodospiraceae bacterium]